MKLIDKDALVAEIERLVNNYDKALDYEAALEDVRNFINSLQEEPVGSIWHDASEKSNEPEDVVIINPSDNTGEVLTRCTDVYQGHIWAYTSILLKLDNPCKIGKNLQEEPVSEKKCMFTKDSYTDEDRKVLCEDCKEKCEYNKKEEPVSEELEEAANNALNNVLNAHEIVNVRSCLEMFRLGTNWQKEKEYTCYEEALEDGAKWKKEQMMAKAIDGDITFDYYGDDDKTYGCIAHDSFCLEDKGLKDRDKVKLIIIKEE